ncbi:hypothetical protein [Isoptericola sp. G70]|uniref:hypothetical protein n=1 Tax=Isoptericola sp. G70 TaxID=3376633 RepID=UPI003A7FCA26
MPDDDKPAAHAAVRAVGGAGEHTGRALVTAGNAVVPEEGRHAPGRARHHRPDHGRRPRP